LLITHFSRSLHAHLLFYCRYVERTKNIISTVVVNEANVVPRGRRAQERNLHNMEAEAAIRAEAAAFSANNVSVSAGLPPAAIGPLKQQDPRLLQEVLSILRADTKERETLIGHLMQKVRRCVLLIC
jgi:hypothetical protein